jgi:hypothetical protein
MFIVDFETFLEIHSDDIYAEFMELGMDGELDSHLEDFEEKCYDDYCTHRGKWSNSS